MNVNVWHMRLLFVLREGRGAGGRRVGDGSAEVDFYVFLLSINENIRATYLDFTTILNGNFLMDRNDNKKKGAK